MIAILDYGTGNLASIKNMLKKAGAEAMITNDKNTISSATKLILPGVGSFDNCAAKLKESGLVEILEELVFTKKIPVLGICVGMQLMTEGSEEGRLPGLGWIKGNCVRFKTPPGSELKIPHMGWMDVNISRPSKLVEGLDEEPRFYFVHSYHVALADPADELLSADHGYRYTAALEHENLLGVQFHPEKSHKFGMKLFQNFIAAY